MKKRLWINLFLFYTVVVIAVAGLVLFAKPSGDVAKLIGWRFLGLDKDQWKLIHMSFAPLLILFVFLHWFFNWKSLKKYLFSKESVVALIAVFLIVSASSMSLPPFSYLLTIRKELRNSWPGAKEAKNYTSLGVKITLNQLCLRLGIPLESAINKLQNEGIKFNKNESIKDIAKNNNIAPLKIINVIKK
jgi:hypothetical protein